MTDFLNLKISQKQVVCPKHGTHKYYISSDIEGHEASRGKVLTAAGYG
jgi:hypothetical protein